MNRTPEQFNAREDRRREMLEDEAALCPKFSKRSRVRRRDPDIVLGRVRHGNSGEIGRSRGTIRVAMTFEEAIKQIKAAMSVTAAMSLRQQARLQQHQEWILANEAAAAEHRELMRKH